MIERLGRCCAYASFFLRAVMALLCSFLIGQTACRASQDAGKAPSSGADLFASHCAACHDHGLSGAPSKVLLTKMPSGAIYNTLTRGPMAAQCAKLSEAERQEVALFLTGEKPSFLPAPSLMCDTGLWAQQSVPSKTTSWGLNERSTRSLGAQNTRLSRKNVHRLQLRWSYVFSNSIKVRAQPVVVGNTLFIGSEDGSVHALDAQSGCTYWTFDASGEIRGAVLYSAASGSSTGTLYFGDAFANVYALDAQTGTLKWKVKVDEHPTARVAGSPLLGTNKLFVPVGSWGEEIAAAASDYDCCTFRGAMVSLDLRDGATLWKRYTIPEPATLHEAKGSRKAQRGPSGAGIWSSPTYDAAHDLLFFGTGDNFSTPSDDNSDAIFALKGASGALVWKHQVLEGDSYNDACLAGQRLPNCPENFGPDLDFTAPPVLAEVGHRELLIAAQKSGDTHAFDPLTGERIWHSRISSESNPLSGGIWFGMVLQHNRLIVPTISYPPIYSTAAAVESQEKFVLRAPFNGLNALDPQTGKLLWHAPFAPECTRGLCQGIITAPVGVPGAVFAGTLDGVIRAYDERNGKTLWQFDTAKKFVSVNGESGKGGVLGGAGSLAVGPRNLYVVSSNVLLSFSLDR